MDRRQFLATSPAFFAALALSAKTVNALPVGFPRRPKQWHYFEFLARDGSVEGYCTTNNDRFYRNDWFTRRIDRERYEELVKYFRDKDIVRVG